MMHCVANGHTIVALANLSPPVHDEMDSFTFQTVGHDMIPHYAACMDVPLYRQAITGESVLQTMDYAVTEGDEIEDLYALLSRVKVCFGIVDIDSDRERCLGWRPCR
jgi:diphthine-ammonia ligase